MTASFLLVGNDLVPADHLTPGSIADSIAKWETLARVSTVDTHCGGKMTCALCQEYIDHGCRGCPVFETTGRSGCMGTPYVEYINEESSLTRKRLLAEREMRFLQAIQNNDKVLAMQIAREG